MKTYKLWFLTTTILFICCTIAFTACSDDDPVSNKEWYTLMITQARKEAYLVTLNALQDENIENSSFTHWTQGEKVEVYINYGITEAHAQHIGTLLAQESGVSVTLKGNVNLEGYDLENILSSKKRFSFLLATSPTIDYTKQDGLLSTVSKRFTSVCEYVDIIGVDENTKELITGDIDVFWNCGWIRRYLLRDTNGLPLKASHFIISCTDDKQEILTQHANYLSGQHQWGDIDITLANSSDLIYVWEEITTPIITAETGLFSCHITAVVDGETYSASCGINPLAIGDGVYTSVLVMEKQTK